MGTVQRAPDRERLHCHDYAGGKAVEGTMPFSVSSIPRSDAGDAIALFHGTDIRSAVYLVNGGELSVERAVANHREEELLFRARKFTASEVSLILAEQALVTNSNRVGVDRHGDWWIVWAHRDWLRDTDAARVFRAVVHDPHQGPNTMYYEVVLRAFASDVISWTPSSIDVVSGDPDPEFMHALHQLPPAARAVAFRVEETHAAAAGRTR